VNLSLIARWCLSFSRNAGLRLILIASSAIVLLIVALEEAIVNGQLC
jgi:hypothetical protein